MTLTLKPFQVQGVQWLRSQRNALLADDMGLGKTVQALMALPTNAKAIVVCSKSLTLNWADECQRWRPDLVPVVVETREGWGSIGHGEVHIGSYDILPEVKAAPDPHVTLIVDEAHKVKNAKAKRTRRVRQLTRYAGTTWLLTGTPLLNKPLDLWGVLASGGMTDLVWTWPQFINLFGGHKNRWGGYEFGEPSPLVHRRLARVMLRRRKSEVLPQLPPKSYRTLRIEPQDNSTDGALDALWHEFKADLSAGTLPPFERFSAVRRELAEQRIPAVLEVAQSHEEQGQPLVAFSAHRGPVEALAQRAGWVAITGGMDAAQRRSAVSAFQSGEVKGIALTIAAGAEGLTLTHASHMLFADLAWTPAMNAQAEDRVCRIGQEANSITITRMVSSHPLDLHVLDLLTSKRQLIDMAIDGELTTDKEAVKTLAG